MSQSQLPPDIRHLPIPVRIQLVDQIWESIFEDEKSFELTPAQKAELDRRLAAHRADPNRGIPWDELRRQLLHD
jgi:putative addiction module component (TIGR02574 family)